MCMAQSNWQQFNCLYSLIWWYHLTKLLKLWYFSSLLACNNSDTSFVLQNTLKALLVRAECVCHVLPNTVATMLFLLALSFFLSMCLLFSISTLNDICMYTSHYMLGCVQTSYRQTYLNIFILSQSILTLKLPVVGWQAKIGATSVWTNFSDQLSP